MTHGVFRTGEQDPWAGLVDKMLYSSFVWLHTGVHIVEKKTETDNPFRNAIVYSTLSRLFIRSLRSFFIRGFLARNTHTHTIVRMYNISNDDEGQGLLMHAANTRTRSWRILSACNTNNSPDFVNFRYVCVTKCFHFQNLKITILNFFFFVLSIT